MTEEGRIRQAAAYEYIDTFLMKCIDDKQRMMWYRWALVQCFMAGATWQKMLMKKEKQNADSIT